MSRIIDTNLEIMIKFINDGIIELKIDADRKIKHGQYVVNNYICKEDLYIELSMSDIPYSDVINFTIIKDGYGYDFSVYNHRDPVVDLNWLCKNKYNLKVIDMDFLGSISFNEITITKFLSCLVIAIIGSDLNITGTIVDITKSIDDNYLDRFINSDNSSCKSVKDSSILVSSPRIPSLPSVDKILKIESSKGSISSKNSIISPTLANRDYKRSSIENIRSIKDSIFFPETSIYPKLDVCGSKYGSRYSLNSSDIPKRPSEADNTMRDLVSRFVKFCDDSDRAGPSDKSGLKNLIDESKIREENLKIQQDNKKKLEETKKARNSNKTNIVDYKGIAKLTNYL